MYADRPAWVPRLLSDLKKQLNPGEYPFFEHSDARFFLAYDGGKPVGRIAAVHNRRHNEHHNEQIGFFGFLDVVDEKPVTEELLKTVESWAREKGFDRLRGPASYSCNEQWGMLVSGFERRPGLMMPYNPPYLPEHVEQIGYEPIKSLLAYETNTDMIRLEFLEKISNRVESQSELELRPLEMKSFQKEARTILDLYVNCWKDNWGFVPPTEEEFLHAAADFRQIVPPELVLFLEEPDGEEVAFIIGLPDMNEALQHLRGTLWSWRIVPFLWRVFVTGINGMRVILMGVKDEYRGKGLESWLIYELIQNGVGRGITRAELSWILGTNDSMIHVLEKIGSEEACRYNLYEKNL